MTVENFCIVNGCQSTKSLVDGEANIDASVNVLTRILAVPDGLVDDVIRFTNSQNPIRTWDLASQNRTQRRLKREFDELPKPYLYITRRGDEPRGKPTRYKNGGKPRVIKLAEVGQYRAALIGQPVLAYKNKAVIYSLNHDDVFPQDVKCEEVLFASICGQEVSEVVKDRRNSTESDNDSKRILIKGGVFFTLAALGEIVKARNGAAYAKSLKMEQITSQAGRERIRKYAQYAIEVYLRAVKDALELTGGELATHVRSEAFFDKIKDRIKTQYRKDALGGEDWLKSALPKLV